MNEPTPSSSTSSLKTSRVLTPLHYPTESRPLPTAGPQKSRVHKVTAQKSNSTTKQSYDLSPSKSSLLSLLLFNGMSSLPWLCQSPGLLGATGRTSPNSTSARLRSNDYYQSQGHQTVTLCRKIPKMLITIAAIYGALVCARHSPMCLHILSDLILTTTWKETETLSHLPRTHS